jgi:DNA-binding LacI/PurR family transcriptional regulator
MAVELLLTAIRSRSTEVGPAAAPAARPSLLPTQLIVRASTAPAA